MNTPRLPRQHASGRSRSMRIASPGSPSTNPAPAPTRSRGPRWKNSTSACARSSEQRPAGLVIRSGKSGFIAGADVSEFGQVREPSAAVPSIRAATGCCSGSRTCPSPPSLPSRLLPGRRARTRHGLPSPRLRGRSEGHAGPAGSDARHSPGFRRHRARGAADGRRDGDGHDADRQEPAPGQGAAGGPHR